MIVAMAIDAKQRKAWIAQSHALKPVVHVGRSGVQPAHLNTLRDHLSRMELVKARIDAESVTQAAEIAQAIADAVPCGLVARIGYVAVFHAGKPGPAASTPDQA